MDTISGYPLSWPVGWARTKRRTRSRFDCTMMEAVRGIQRELRAVGVSQQDIVISTNVELRLDGLPYSNRRAPADPSAAVWFKRKGESHVLACDRWDRVEHNLRAIEKHLGAMRGQERWGVGSMEQAFSGYKALPESTGGPSWWLTLGFAAPPEAFNLVRSRYRDLVKLAHPDQGGDRRKFEEITKAYRAAEQALGGEVATA